MNQKNGSVYNKLLLLFAVTVFPFIIIGTWILLTVTNEYRKQIINMEYVKTHNTIQQFNNSLDGILETSHYFFEQSNVLKLSNRPEQLTAIEQTLAVNSLREQLSSIPSANTLIDYLRIYIEKMERVYNSTGYPYGSFQDITSEEYQTVSDMAQNGIIRYQNEKYISILIPSSPFSKSNAVIELLLSVKIIKSQFNNIALDKNDYFILSSNNNEFFIHNIPFSNDIHTIRAMDKEAPFTDMITINGTSYILFAENIPLLKSTFYRLVSTDMLLAPLQFITLYISAFFLLIFIGLILFFLIARRMIHTPMSELVAGLAEIEKGNYKVQISYNVKNEFSYLYHGFNLMATSLDLAIATDYQTKLLLQQAGLKQLQAQINPHFLYNSFFMLQRIIQGGLEEEAIAVTGMLGKYFQYITKNSNDLVSLKEEYEHARIYSQIQELRFEGRISVSFDDIPGFYSELMVPKLILQPIIENSFTHAFNNMIENGILVIQFISSENMLKILIDDNGNSLTDQKLGTLIELTEKAKSGDNKEMHGILNICRRLSIFTGYPGCFTLQRSNLGGLSVCLTISDRRENN